MKDFDNIEDWYREELNNYNVDPDKGSWDALSNDLDANMTLTDDNISEWYKREVSKLEERPDYTVWEKLATKLDTASVWDKLVVSLNRYDQMIWWRNTIIKGSAILLLFLGSYQLYDRYFGQNDDLAITNQSSSTSYNEAIDKSEIITGAFHNEVNNEPASTLNNSSSQHSIVPNKNKENNNTKVSSLGGSDYNEARNKASNQTTAKTEGNSSSQKRLSPKKESNNNLIASINGNNRMEKVTGKRIEKLGSYSDLEQDRELILGDRRQITEEDMSHRFASSDFLVKKEKNKIVFNSKRFSSYFTYGLYARRFYVGMNMGVKKQGLITQMNKQGVLANASQADYLDFGYNVGFTGGYILSDKVNLESNLNVLSTSGFDRKFSDEGFNTNEKLNLDYTTVNLLVKKMNTKSTFDNKVYSTNLIGGVYMSYLRTSRSSYTEGAYINHDFNAIDYGFVLGIEQDRYLTKSLIITPGFRYNQGLSNVFANDNAFDYGYNFSLEFNLGIKYIFLKKSK